MTPPLDPTIAALHELSERDDYDFRPAIGVVNDLGRALADPDPDALASVTRAMAVVRENLEYEGRVDHTPSEALHGDKSGAYLGGALWAASDIVDAFLARITHTRRHGRQQLARRELRALIEKVAASEGVVTPGMVRQYADKEGFDVGSDKVSRALGDLLEAGVLESASPPEDADRRRRYYQLTADAEAQEVPARARIIAREAVERLARYVDADEIPRLLEESLERAMTGDEA